MSAPRLAFETITGGYGSLIAEKKAAGFSFIVVEQNLAFAERIADRYLVMDQGRAMLAGPRSQIDRSHVLAHLHV
jgi:branched-chain amino acid transport system ATP-binding protein